MSASIKAFGPIGAAAVYLYTNISRCESEIRELQDRVAVLKEMRKILRICPGCDGRGQTINESDEGDREFVPCRACLGKGQL